MTRKTKIEKSMNSKSTAIAGLLINLIAPGLGTIIIGKYDIGSVQLILLIIGLCFSAVAGYAFGIPWFIAMWIWALVVSIKNLKEIKKS